MFCGEDDFGCQDNLNNLGIIFEIESGADVNNSYTESCVDNSSTGGEIRGTIVSAGVLRGPPQDDAPIGDTDLGSEGCCQDDLWRRHVRHEGIQAPSDHKQSGN